MSGLLSATAAISARAQPAGPSIEWRGDASCPRPTRLEAELAARSERDLEELEPLAFSLEVTQLSTGGYALSLQATGGADPQTRAVELASCEEAQRAAVVLIATALAPAAPPPSQPEQRRDQAFSPWSLRASGLMDVRSAPRITGGLGLGAGYDLSPRIALWADARYLFARTSTVPGARVEVDLFALAVGGALRWFRAGWSGGPLLELEAGALRGKASQAADGSRFAGWLSAWGGAGAGYQMDRFGLHLSALLGVPILRPGFGLDGESATYRTAFLSGRVSLTLSVALGAKKSQDGGQ